MKNVTNLVGTKWINKWPNGGYTIYEFISSDKFEHQSFGKTKSVKTYNYTYESSTITAQETKANAKTITMKVVENKIIGSNFVFEKM